MYNFSEKKVNGPKEVIGPLFIESLIFRCEASLLVGVLSFRNSYEIFYYLNIESAN